MFLSGRRVSVLAGTLLRTGKRRKSVEVVISHATRPPPAVATVRSTTIIQESTGVMAAPAANTMMTAPGPPRFQYENAMVESAATSATTSTTMAGDKPIKDASDVTKTAPVN